MVKDIFREIKRKLFQFIAIVLITFLGVGFYIGIQVTGYNMRLTGDTYMKNHNVFDNVVMHTLGIDEPMVKGIEELTGGKAAGILFEDMFVKSNNFDAVLKVFDYDEYTKEDLSVTEGRLPTADSEAVVDKLMKDLQGFKIGDTLTLHKQDIFDQQEVTIVGFVESSLYMNMERGQSSLGTGKVQGFIYAQKLKKLSDSVIYSQVRIKNPTVANVESKLTRNSEVLSNERFERAVSSQRKELDEAQVLLDEKRVEANASFVSAQQELDAARRTLDSSKKELETGISTLSGISMTGSLDERLEVAQANYERAKSIIEQAIESLKLEIETVESDEVKVYLQTQLDTATRELETLRTQFDAGYATLSAGVAAYNQGVQDLQDATNTFESNKQEALSELDSAQRTIEDALHKLNTADHGSFVVQSREEAIIGYQAFYDDSHRIENIGKVFPMIFFGVAVLVTLSTMSRMIDESRMQVGVYKALGYSPFKISMKYVMFAVFAWLIGSVLGMAFGFIFIPNIIYNAYRIMYLTPDLQSGFVLQYAMIPLIVSFLSSAGVAWYKSLRVTNEKTASLLRPVAPKKGQRVFLERIPFIWNRLSFLLKVSIRNLFRNKTRFFMTIIGIGGCCGLLITGFGLKHSIYSIVDKQFHSVINYDGLTFYDDFDLDTTLFTDHEQVYATTVTINNKDVSLYAADDLEHFREFIHLRDRQTKQDLELAEDSVLITEKLANLLNVKAGDTVKFTYEKKPITLTVTGIVENYANHYIYMNYSQYQSVMDGHSKMNLSFFKTDQDHTEVSEKLLKSPHVLTVQFLDDIAENYRDMMGSFDIVIVVIVLCALALEIIVLMNLISMNMSERKKELATLKVLGFFPGELATYVLRENVILTIIALIFGVVFGRILHLFVVTSAEIDAVMFNREMEWTSYFYAIVMTFGLSVLLNLLMARRANKVNMSEALKTFDS